MKTPGRVQYEAGSKNVQNFFKASMRAKLLGVISVSVILFAPNIVVAIQDEGRRSAEADNGRQRSAEAEEGKRRSPEAEANAERNPLQNFKPQTRREEELYKMIVQLQREVAALRSEVKGQQRDREGGQKRGREGGQERGREGGQERRGEQRDRSPELDTNWQKTKVGGIFRAYDKNGDQAVSLDEWLAMTNGNISDARRKLQTQRFGETKPGDDQKLSPAEFFRWWDQKEGAQRESRKQDQRGESEGRRKSAEGKEGDRRSPEAEQGARRSPEADRG